MLSLETLVSRHYSSQDIIPHKRLRHKTLFVTRHYLSQDTRLNTSIVLRRSLFSDATLKTLSIPVRVGCCQLDDTLSTIIYSWMISRTHLPRCRWLSIVEYYSFPLQCDRFPSFGCLENFNLVKKNAVIER